MNDMIEKLLNEISTLNDDEKIIVMNDIKTRLHQISPFKNEPVDCVLWVRNDTITANDYNPNSVAPPEMELLRHSINHDGFTQPVVTWPGKQMREVVDGFHRMRVSKECEDVVNRIHGYVPVVTINPDCTDRNDRIASTIRHNRARGKHQVVAMSDIVIELKRRNWADEKIGRELGMEPDEVLRLTQITGLAEMFADKEFSKAWEVEQIDENDALNDESIDEVIE